MSTITTKSYDILTERGVWAVRIPKYPLLLGNPEILCWWRTSSM